MESLIPIITHLEQKFEPFADSFTLELLKLIGQKNQEITAMKCCIDVIYKLTEDFSRIVEPHNTKI